MKNILLISIIIAALAMTTTLMAGIPILIHYNGRLTDSADQPLDTTVQMIFSLYGDSTGGTPISADTITAVVVSNGLFNANFGVWDPGDGSFGDDTISFCGVKVGNDPEITPRARITTAPYAAFSANVATINKAMGGTIIGSFSLVGDETSPKALADLRIGGLNDALSMPNPGTKPYPGKLSVRSNTDVANVTLDGQTGMATVKGFTMNSGTFSSGFVLTTDGFGVGTWQSGVSDLDWDKDPTSPPTTALFTHGAWGIARYGNILWGNNRNSHVNLGDGCTTGRSGQNYGWATIGGGQSNQAIGHYTTIGGGYSNIVGNGNVPSGDEARLATIAGGYSNEAHAVGTSVGGGEFNKSYDVCCAVGGGYANQAGLPGASLTEAYYAAIGGGQQNLAQASYSSILGGYNNQAAGLKSAIGGGDSNYVATGTSRGTVGGGYFNSVKADGATISGGYHNTIETTGPYGTIGGGDTNYVEHRAGTIAGGEYDSVLAPDGTIAGG